jgi:uncharacterized protein YndB with AHSA1/START domain
MTETRAFTLIEDLPYPPMRVWRAFASADMLGKWLMPSDYRPEIGHRFRMQGIPVPAVNFSGIVLAEVLEVVPGERLKISWTDEQGSVDWTVTWTLAPNGDGTRLTMVHDGFDMSERQQMSYAVMSKGWVGMTRKIAEIVGEVAPA